MRALDDVRSLKILLIVDFTVGLDGMASKCFLSFFLFSFYFDTSAVNKHTHTCTHSYAPATSLVDPISRDVDLLLVWEEQTESSRT